MNRTFLLALILSLMTLASQGLGQTSKGTRWAILIGVNDYASLEDLKYCSRDMQALKNQLVDAGFDSDQVFLVHDSAEDKKFLPFKSNIEQQLNIILGFAEDDDMVVVAFSGHGMHFDGRTYLCPTNADPERPDTLLPLDDVYGKLKSCRANLRLMIVDACRNDPRPAGRKSGTPKQDLTRLGEALKKPPQGIVLLASCAPGEISYESKDFGRGVFMNYLLEAVSGKADENGDSVVSIGEAAQYAGCKTKIYVAREFFTSQRPFLTGDLSTDVLAYSLVPRVRPPALPGLKAEISNSIGMRLKLIPAGEFMMGSPESEEDRDSDESPQHRVRLTRPFYLGIHEVTVGQFSRFVADASYKTEAERGDGAYGWNSETKKWEKNARYNWQNPGFQQSDDHPVVCVSWSDAVAFCDWLSRKEGKKYGLPTEAEWEYACRGGTTTMYYHGDDPEGLARVGNVADVTAKAKFSEWNTISARDGHVYTAPVGQFRPNGFGLYDMHGNVWEWCSDWYDREYYAGSPTDDPTGPSAGSSRVSRGGGWNAAPGYCRSAYRAGDTPGCRFDVLGFRVASDLVDASGK
ncbi:MAG: SUMF1/EgtB/PvdO family nonheme iron enzyme [Pirellulales bacterium]|nr:SUMF1/EgtB/PvdO family nonheme iron enzyme [Pirellulales bacterium]